MLEPKAPSGEQMVVAFDHPFFRQFSHGFFVNQPIDDTGQDGPAFVIDMGNRKFSLSFEGIRNEFEFKGTNDDVMLEVVGRGLEYVNILFIGDTLPREIYASQSPILLDQNHRQRSEDSINRKIAEWRLSDVDAEARPAPPDTTGPEMEQEALDAAIAAVTKYLNLGSGQGDGGTQEVRMRMQRMADELSYIEALREKRDTIGQMDSAIRAARSAFSSDDTRGENIDSVLNLIGLPLAEYADKLGRVDAQTANILPALADTDASVAVIRKVRDDLHADLFAWDEVLENWNAAGGEVSDGGEISGFIDELYRFLAVRQMPPADWVVTLQRRGDLDTGMGFNNLPSWGDRHSTKSH